MSHATGTWHWGIRLIPIIGFFSVFLILLLVQDPPRGSSEGAINLSVNTWWSDMKFLSTKQVDFSLIHILKMIQLQAD